MPYAKDMDAVLHRERTSGPHSMPWSGLADGAFVETPDGPAVVASDRLGVFDEEVYAYTQRLPRPVGGVASVLTPPSNVAVLAAGYPLQIATLG